ncbi:hypothetical protein GCM10017600_68960 [Streptosporangium carneum]|uniref:NB-ARC domain-containing protein n=1 Tax=Streptosporangium carneum TaxID=47481 RepID=A0A9W6I7G0_9ACTN|nr:hypothetical protein GCM10017600_68960 [Streptosporangium carneum]
MVGFFADPLHIPDEVLDVLDKRASVISMFTGLVGLLIAGAALLLQLRSPSLSAVAPPADNGVPTRAYSGDHIDLSGGVFHGSVTGTATTRAEAAGRGAAALGGNNPGVIVTGRNASITLTNVPVGMAAAGPGLPPVTQVPANSLFSLPRRASAVFIGREPQLRQLAQALKQGPGMVAQAVVGLGGIGKTELVLQHATIHRHDYDLIWWMDAETSGAVRVGLVELCRALCAGTASAAAAQALAQEAEDWALAWLNAHSRWLLVFDNVEEAAHVQPYLGRLNTGHVLITSRRSTEWTDAGTVVQLEVLEHSTAVTMLRETIGEAAAWDQTLAEELAKELDGLPLALRHVGAYIATVPGMDLTRYLRLLRTAPVSAGGRPGVLEVVGRSLTLTITRITQINPLATKMLHLLACYAPEQLPCQVLYGMQDANEVAVAEALRVLTSYNMISRSADGDAVIMHRLVQAVIRTDLSKRQRTAIRKRAAALIDAALPDDPTDSTSWPAYAQLLPHARAILTPRSGGMVKTIIYLNASSNHHITELYTKAVEQLGHDKAAVRLAGLYALERLAQDNSPHRQTVINVICAYLRMPYTPPKAAAQSDLGHTVPCATVARVSTSATGHDPYEERQVRLTAQRVLADHLRYSSLAKHQGWQRLTSPPARFWPDIRLDLTGATLIDLDFVACRITEAQFSGVTFIGNAVFSGMTFTRDAWFDGTTFTRKAVFSEVTYGGDTRFDGATFQECARFDRVTFMESVSFSGVAFIGKAVFSEVTYGGDTWFTDARLSQPDGEHCLPTGWKVIRQKDGFGRIQWDDTATESSSGDGAQAGTEQEQAPETGTTIDEASDEGDDM